MVQMVQLNRMTENPEEIPSVDECLRKYDADVLVPTSGIDVDGQGKGGDGAQWRA